MVHYNEFDQPIGDEVSGWTPRPRPERVTLNGRFCTIEPLSTEKHGADLIETLLQRSENSIWTYMAAGPFETTEDFMEFLRVQESSADPLHFTIIDHELGKAVGTFSLMHMTPEHGTIEVGWVMYSQLLKRTATATEAQYLLMKYALGDLGYRRYEWKCDALNEPSRRAARRLGFRFEGIFRNALIYKNRSRDTAWFALTDEDWPHQKQAFENWLRPENFDNRGQQKEALERPSEL
ncbi:GNAT family N-acetyltransferase [Rothia sp. ND6WE1A]|uniref:GNAT family N-acetyltransferase n=1 Tax=Rothia sp. ND6WE1A TaxID=1848190 RepID=UPI00082A08BC|nr:GNAT family protein [Rothia sp. ND6WE1A]